MSRITSSPRKNDTLSPGFPMWLSAGATSPVALGSAPQHDRSRACAATSLTTTVSTGPRRLTATPSLAAADVAAALISAPRTWPRRSADSTQVEPGADRRRARQARHAAHQPRDHLPAHPLGQARRRRPVATHPHHQQVRPQALSQRRFAGRAPRQALDRRATRRRSNCAATIGHWEGDTVMGSDMRHCVLTLVERKTGFAILKKLKARNTREVTRAATRAIRRHCRHFKTITFDNGTEFHDYAQLEDASRSRSTSPRRTTRGSAAATRTSTACFASTCPRASA